MSRHRRRHAPRPPAPPRQPAAPAPPSTAGATAARSTTNASGIVGLFHGVDRRNHPAIADPSATPDYMSWLIQRSDLRWVNCYLTQELDSSEIATAFPNLSAPEWPASENRTTRHWVGNVALMQAQGWGVLPLFFGYNWPARTGLTPTAQAGKIHARMAKLVALRRGFQPGSVLYIDDEASVRDLTADELAYFAAYFAELARPDVLQWPDPPAAQAAAATKAAYRPGYYGHDGTAAQLLLATPDLVVWSDDFGTHSPHQVGHDDTKGSLIPLTNLDRAALGSAVVASSPMRTSYPTDIDARVKPIARWSRGSQPSITGRLWPMALQRWWTQSLRMPSTAPVGDSAWPARQRTVDDWDFSESLVRDPSQPVAEPRLGVSRGAGPVTFGAVTSQDAVYRSGAPAEPLRGSLSADEGPFLGGQVGRCVEAGDGRPHAGVAWSGPFVHPFSPVAGEINSTALLLVTTTGRLALFNSLTAGLRMLFAADRAQGAAASTDPFAVRVPHALAMAATYTGIGYDAVWVGTDQHLWTGTGQVASGDIGAPSQVRADLVVHPAARVALGRSTMSMRFLTVAADGTLVSAELTGTTAPDRLGAVLPSGPLGMAAAPGGDLVAVAQGHDHRLMFSILSAGRSGPATWSALAPLGALPASVMVSPLSGIAVFPFDAEVRVAAVGSDLRLYEWVVPASGTPTGPTPLAPPGMPLAHPFSDVAGLAVNGASTYGIARADRAGGAMVTPTAVTSF